MAVTGTADLVAARVEGLEVAVYRVPTEQREADGTLEWDHTTVVAVHAHAAGVSGLGWTYGSPACAEVVRGPLIGAVTGTAVDDVPGAWSRMRRALRNDGVRGIGAGAVSAVDLALWDLKARLLGLPLARLLGRTRERLPVYGSGGFTSYTDAQLIEQLQGWVTAGARAVKIKIGESWGGREERDLARVEAARRAVGSQVAIFVDANGGYAVGQAVRVGHALGRLDVRWYEEPVSSDDLPGMAAVRQQVTPDVACGEYAYTPDDVLRICRSGAVDCLQADVTRCLGITGWLQAAAQAAAHGLQISAHCAPALHLAVAAAVPNLRHLEWFHDHVRLEQMLFTGVPGMVDGCVTVPDTQPGNGFAISADAAGFRTAD